MKSFNEYKNGIDTVTESMKTELLDLINEIDFTSFHSIKESLEKNRKFERFESVFPPFIDGYFAFDNHNITLKYNDEDKTIKIIDLDDYHNYIEVQADMALLKYISTANCALDMTKKPIIESKILGLEIEDLILKQTSSFSSLLVYDAFIGIDNTVKCKVFFIMEKKKIILESEINIDENENIIFNKINVYNVKKKELKAISKFTTEELNITEIKYIFENILVVDLGEGIISEIEENGFSYFDSDEFHLLLELKTSF